MIRLRVIGTPATKGSMRAFMRPGMRFPVVTSASGHALKAWEKAVREAAHQAAAGRAPYDGPVQLTAVFTVLRPASISVKKRPACTVKPDLDKLLRGVLDPLSGVVYVDDAQIISAQITKRYGAVPGAEITIQPAVTDNLFDSSKVAS